MNLISVSYRAEDIGELLLRYEAALPDHAWPNWVLGNHDRSRIATRVGAAQARVAAMLLHEPRTWPGPASGTMALGTHPDRAGDRIGAEVTLRGDEGVIIVED